MSSLIYTIECKCNKCGEIHLWEKPRLFEVLTGEQLAAGKKLRIGMSTKGGGKQACGLNGQVTGMHEVISTTHVLAPHLQALIEREDV